MDDMFDFAAIRDAIAAADPNPAAVRGLDRLHKQQMVLIGNAMTGVADRPPGTGEGNDRRPPFGEGAPVDAPGE